MNLNVNINLLKIKNINICIACLVLLDKRLQSLLIIRQAAMETQTLLCLSQPLQQDMNSRVKLLSLQPKDTHQSSSYSQFTFYLTTVGALQSCTWHRACSSRACLDTERLHTVSQRVPSSCIWTLTQDESSWLLSISSLAERLRAWTLTVLFPNSFWKTCSGQSAKDTVKHHEPTHNILKRCVSESVIN